MSSQCDDYMAGKSKQDRQRKVGETGSEMA